MFYTVAATIPLSKLLNDALILAHTTGHDVFNALDIFENGEVLRGGWRSFWGMAATGPVRDSCCQNKGVGGREGGRVLLVGSRSGTHPGSSLHMPKGPHPHTWNHFPITDLKFGIGDGKLRYYLYNWRVGKTLAPSEVGLVML